VLVEHGADLGAREEMHGSTPVGGADHKRKGAAVPEYLLPVSKGGW
jgi:hypothetical protein